MTPDFTKKGPAPAFIPAVAFVCHDNVGDLMIKQPLKSFTGRYDTEGEVIGANADENLVQGHGDSTSVTVVLKIIHHHINPTRIIIPQRFMKIHGIVESAKHMGHQVTVSVPEINQLGTVCVHLENPLTFGRQRIKNKKDDKNSNQFFHGVGVWSVGYGCRLEGNR